MKPDILCLNETWLNDSTPRLSITGYEQVSRKDRPQQVVTEFNHGGIAVFRRAHSILITHVEDSTIAERSWHTLHTDLGPILVGLWYRPPSSPDDHILFFRVELERLMPTTVGCIVFGDLNI